MGKQLEDPHIITTEDIEKKGPNRFIDFIKKVGNDVITTAKTNRKINNLKYDLKEAISNAEEEINDSEKKHLQYLEYLHQELLKLFNFYQITQLGRILDIPDMREVVEHHAGRNGNTWVKRYRVRREFHEYVELIPERQEFEKTLNFAEMNNVHSCFEIRRKWQKSNDELNTIRQLAIEKRDEIANKLIPEIKALGGNVDGYDFIQGSTRQENSEYANLIENIKKFRPPALQSNSETNYQNLLFGYLQHEYPQVKMEEQRGSSRPDLSIGDIGIEIKGPTYYDGLQTIADKLLRYPKKFESGIIVVLFNVQVPETFYNEWVDGVKSKYPNIEVLRF